MRKRLLSITLTLCMILTLLPTVAFAATDYGIWVGTVKVTSDNVSNVLGNGTVSYNAADNTLTLTNARITAESFDNTKSKGFISRESGDLRIWLSGSNTVEVSSVTDPNSGFCGIYAGGKVSIRGAAGTSLSAVSTS